MRIVLRRIAVGALSTGMIATAVVGGDFGDATVTAVKDFQKKHKLGDTGKVDLMTWNALVKDAL
jgi:peptidoglycan hydrolase-like protein with peptidoglycan-binding domain